MARPRVRLLCLLGALLCLCGCASLVGKATHRFADSLTDAILDQNDPATVKDGMPAYLLLLDGLIINDPQNAQLLLAGAKLYGAYAGGFVDEAERSQVLANRGYGYARRALCLRLNSLCAKLDDSFESFQAEISRADSRQIDVLFEMASSWATKIQVNTSDWNAIADIPKVQALLERVVQLNPAYENGNPELYLGVMNSIRPASLGGKPAEGKAYFERAIELAGGKNQMMRVLYAEHYARLVFDQPLHDRLLEAVLAADPAAPRLTLVNMLAKRRAKLLLESGKEYF